MNAAWMANGSQPLVPMQPVAPGALDESSEPGSSQLNLTLNRRVIARAGVALVCVALVATCFYVYQTLHVCAELPPVDGMSITYDNFQAEGSNATCACGPGLVVAGLDTLTCLADGSWNGAAPTACNVRTDPHNTPVQTNAACARHLSFQQC